MPLIEPIQVEGLAEVRRALRAMDTNLAKALRVAANKAAQVVVEDAQRRTPRRSGRAAGSIKARSTQTAARVVSGGPRAPHMPWLDYGGRVGANRAVHRPFIKEGRYVYPALADNREKVAEVFRTEVIAASTDAGLEVS